LVELWIVEIRMVFGVEDGDLATASLHAIVAKPRPSRRQTENVPRANKEDAKLFLAL
jgi:hypothetical protein